MFKGIDLSNITEFDLNNRISFLIRITIFSSYADHIDYTRLDLVYSTNGRFNLSRPSDAYMRQ